MSGKGSERRRENTSKVREKLDQVMWSKRDKSKDTFKIKINGKSVTDAK